MDKYPTCIIKSFKHDGHLHRMWLENWLIPAEMLHETHAAEGMSALINCQTRIQEADGKQWISKIPAVSFFIPGQWFNVVALLEDAGTRYYCNIASPPYVNGNVITYIDYDLDVIRLPGGEVHIVDREEYELHRQMYHYPPVVDEKAAGGLDAVLARIRQGEPPFQDEIIRSYYEHWKQNQQT